MVKGVDHMTVFRTLQNQQLKLYHLQRVHSLKNVDYEQRWEFCLFFYIKFQLNTYLVSVMFTDEAIFTQNRITNVHNNHYWAEGNLHGICPFKFVKDH